MKWRRSTRLSVIWVVFRRSSPWIAAVTRPPRWQSPPLSPVLSGHGPLHQSEARCSWLDFHSLLKVRERREKWINRITSQASKVTNTVRYARAHYPNTHYDEAFWNGHAFNMRGVPETRHFPQITSAPWLAKLMAGFQSSARRRACPSCRCNYEWWVPFVPFWPVFDLRVGDSTFVSDEGAFP